jgi:hypothetical protein
MVVTAAPTCAILLGAVLHVVAAPIAPVCHR